MSARLFHPVTCDRCGEQVAATDDDGLCYRCEVVCDDCGPHTKCVPCAADEARDAWLDGRGEAEA